eukprot:m.8505 g.8505  ORF g.8505 m.8505 type:complete len:631 (+) comp6112_c0_seq1:107-1999(+)
MSWFKKEKERGRSKSPRPQQKQEKKKLQQALWEAENSPSKQVDLSSCGLESISSTITSTVRNKEALVVNDNAIVNVSSTISSLTALKVLDMHNNLIKHLPPEIEKLSNLKVLNLENNKMTSFPECVLQLPKLETLNLSHNNIKKFPNSIGKLEGLRTLNIGHNAITRLPLCMSGLLCMDTLIITGNPISHPAVDVDSATTEEVMKLLCEEAQVEYVPPSQFLLHKLKGKEDGVSEDDLLAQRRREEEEINKLLHKKKIDDKRKEAAEVTRRREEEELQERRKRHLKEEQEKTNRLAREMEDESAEMSARVLALQGEEKKRNEEMLARIAKQNEEEDEKAKEIVEKWNKEKNNAELRQQLLDSENKAEQQLIALSIAREASHQAAVEAMHQAEAQHNELHSAHVLVLDDARKVAMEQFRAHQNTLDNNVNAFMNDIEESRKRQGEVLLEEEKRQTQLMTGAAVESAKQREKRVKEIEAMNQRLDILSQQYQQSVAEKNEQEAQRLAASRVELELQLHRLQEQQQQREKELTQTILTLEESDKKNYRAYWEAKLNYAMQHVLEGEIPCDSVVKSVLASVNMSHLEPIFARNHVDAVVLRVLSDTDLQAMGITAVGDRKKVLLGIQNLFVQKE